jgi:predicted alpha-1,2-mannosidase
MRSVAATPLVCLVLVLSALSAEGCSKSTEAAPAPAADAGPQDDGAIDNPRPPATPVDPLFIGSGGFGFSFGSSTVSAAAPNGLAKVGPDTTAPGGAPSFLHYSGYWYGDDTIQGFSHLHLHGTGGTDYGVLSVMPLETAVTPALITPAGYGSTFKKSTEKLGYGTYSVALDRGAIQVAIAATPHAAHERFTYPAGKTAAHLLFDLDHHLSGGKITSAEVALDPATKTFRGRLHSIGGMSGGFGGYDVYFEARTKNAWLGQQTWSAGNAPAAGTSATGTGVGFALDLDLASDVPAELELAISMVDADGAKANLAAELPAWDFDATKAKTAADWKSLTDRVQFVGGTKNQQSMMEAARYHAFLMPSRTQDVDGRYRGGDQKIYTASGFTFCSDLSLWDTYRTLHPFYALVAKDRALDAVRSLVEMAKQRGGSFPKWPIAIGDAGSMIGAPAEIVIADAYARGIRGFDAEEAWGLLRGEALDPTPPPGGRGGRGGAEAYLTLGYVPEKSGTATSKTIEFAQADFALAGLGQALGHTAEAAQLAARAHGWRKLFDPATKMLWAKDESGAFATSHENPYDWQDEFAEADAAQTVWGAPHDVDGYVALFGSKAAAVTELEGFFEQAKTNWGETDWSSIISAGAIRPYYWAANEPDIHAPYLFAQLGRPDLAQKWSRWALENAYGPGADGLPGNDDGGTMSTWLLFTALGIYPVVGTDRFVLGAPLFPQATIALGDGASGTFTIEGQGVSDTALYVQSVTLDGKPLTVPELRVSDLHAGGKLVFVMGAQPSTWGQAP